MSPAGRETRALAVWLVPEADAPLDAAGLAAWRARLAPLAPKSVTDQAPALVEGDLLLVPVRADLSAGTLAALREIHEAEGNAATLLATGPDGFERDGAGRLVGVGRTVTGEVATGVAVVHRSAWEPASTAPADLAALVARLRAGGRPVGAWRAPEREEPALCPLCSAEPWPDPETGVLLVRSRALLIVDPAGFNSGQLLCCPRRHVTCAALLDDEERTQAAALLVEGERRLREVYQFDALNLGIASGLGGHIAFRLIPRWTGDLNFLPLVGGFKPVPESPRAAWHRLEGGAR